MIEFGLFLLSAAALAFEVNLTRLFSVAQFHHFAFLVVSLALLGYGASGTVLTVLPTLARGRTHRTLVLAGWGFAATALGSYLVSIYIPLDTFRIGRDWRQVLVLAVHYLTLSLPFFFAGAAVSLALANRPRTSGVTYAANLLGSAAGCLLAVIAPSLVGGEGTVLVCVSVAVLAAACFGAGTVRGRLRQAVRLTAYLALAIGALLGAYQTPPALEVRLSPYKALSYALLYPDAQLVSRRWNAYARVDVVRSSAIRSLPGRGFRCEQAPPAQLALTVDGDSLVPISRVPVGFGELPFTYCLLTALPYRLRPGAHALILEPHGGFDVLVALSEGAESVTAAEPNRLIVDAVRAAGDWAGDLYRDERVEVAPESSRAFAAQASQGFDVVAVALTDTYRPVTSGAYSLAEDYRYTVEAFRDYYALVRPGGVLAIARWLQMPPSEALRALATTVEAVERSGEDPRSSVVALRSYQQMLVLARRGAFTGGELDTVREFAAARAFDLVYLPDLDAGEANRYNILAKPVYYKAAQGLLGSVDRDSWYKAYQYRIEPPTDSRPFFAHYFRWRQARAVLAQAGHVWQPFGGAGYFVLLALLGLAIASAGTLIVLPLALQRRPRQARTAVPTTLIYFGMLGLGFLLVEIPLLQQFILYLSHPAYAVATVLFTILCFSGLGSLLSEKLPWASILLLAALVVGYALLLPRIGQAILAFALWARVLLSVFALAPVGLLMGVAFPKGLSLIRGRADAPVSLAWAVNGALSVVASVLAALLAFDLGFPAVMALGALCYAVAWLTARGHLRATGGFPRP